MPAVYGPTEHGGIVIVAVYRTRKTSQDTNDGLNKQLTEQRHALDKTLKEKARR